MSPSRGHIPAQAAPPAAEVGADGVVPAASADAARPMATEISRELHVFAGKGVVWTYPTDAELTQEVQTEYWLQEALHPDASSPKALLPESIQAMVQALKGLARPETIDPAGARFHGKSAFTTYANLRPLTTGFGKDPDSMLQQFEEGGTLPMPVAIRHLNGEVEILGGATRTGLAMLRGEPVEALVLQEAEARDRKARLLVAEARELAGGSPAVFDRVRAYFLDGAAKPMFVDEADAHLAYRVGLRLRKVAALLGVEPKAMERFKRDDWPDAFEAPPRPDPSSQAFRSWFQGSKVVDAKGEPLVVFHGSRSPIEVFDPKVTKDGGLHFGTEAQASMRAAGLQKALTPVYLKAENLQRSRDTGGNWAGKIASAKAAGKDGIVYLNRYEGIQTETVMKASREGVDLDRLTDAQFRRYVPEAKDSYIVFEPTQIKSAVSNSGAFDPKNPNIHT